MAQKVAPARAERGARHSATLYCHASYGGFALLQSKAPRGIVTTPSDDPSPIAIAYQWASRIIVVALEMVLPGMAGHWLDQQLRTVVLFMLIGFGVGCTAAVVHLIQMTRADESRKRND